MDYNKDMDLGSTGLSSSNVKDCMGYCYANYPTAMGGVLLSGSNWCVCKGAMVGTPTLLGTQHLSWIPRRHRSSDSTALYSQPAASLLAFTEVRVGLP
jgi:hypothetical protein